MICITHQAYMNCYWHESISSSSKQPGGYAISIMNSKAITAVLMDLLLNIINEHSKRSSFWGYNQHANIGADNSLARYRPQNNIRNNNDLVYWRIYASPGFNNHKQVFLEGTLHIYSRYTAMIFWHIAWLIRNQSKWICHFTLHIYQDCPANLVSIYGVL